MGLSRRPKSTEKPCSHNFPFITGTAADIIEFFDSFKDKKIADEPILVFLTLSIWSWSLLQFTIVLTATRSRKPRGATSDAVMDEEYEIHFSC